MADSLTKICAIKRKYSKRGIRLLSRQYTKAQQMTYTTTAADEAVPASEGDDTINQLPYWHDCQPLLSMRLRPIAGRAFWLVLPPVPEQQPAICQTWLEATAAAKSLSDEFYRDIIGPSGEWWHHSLSMVADRVPASVILKPDRCPLDAAIRAAASTSDNIDLAISYTTSQNLLD